MYKGLNPRRGLEYELKVTGTLPNGEIMQLNRGVHLGKTENYCFLWT